MIENTQTISCSLVIEVYIYLKISPEDSNIYIFKVWYFGMVKRVDLLHTLSSTFNSTCLILPLISNQAVQPSFSMTKFAKKLIIRSFLPIQKYRFIVKNRNFETNPTSVILLWQHRLTFLNLLRLNSKYT